MATTTLLDRVPVDRIGAEARQVRVGRTVLALLVGLLYAVGWTAGKVSLALAFAWAAVKLGWRDARDPAGRARGPAG